MAAHNDWIAKGFADGVFMSVGSLVPGEGGAVIARGESRADFEARVAADPFVSEGVVKAEIIEIDVKKCVPELAVLKGGN